MTKIMLITGGGRGIGAATAKLAAERGFAVAVNYVTNEAAAQAVVRAIRDHGGSALALQADVGREEEVLRLFRTLDDSLGPPTVLVNNAGIVAAQGPVADMTAERMERVLRVNVLGTMLCAREAVRRLSTGRGGTGGVIVNLSSAAARHGSPGEYVDYAAAKAAVDTFTLGLAREVAAEGIRVNAVRPGIIATDIHASGGDPSRIERLRDGIPMRRAGSAEEVARAILWLASDEAAYVTGAILDVSGGR